MKFRLIESVEDKEMYEGWTQEDIELFEAIDWDEQGDGDYDAGCAYLDSAVCYSDDDIERSSTEFHKFFKNDPYSQPYYKPVEKNPFEVAKDISSPVTNGKTHRDYKVYNQYDVI